jgi:large repetitive protein
LTYTPNALFNGKDSLVYTVCDNGTPLPAQCDTAIVYLTVTGVNHPPVVNTDVVTTPEDAPIVVNVLTNDTDPDSNLDPKTVTVSTPPANGTVTVDPITGAVTYTPNPNFNGKDSLIYKVCDSGNPVLCDTAKVYFNVTPVNDAPIANLNTGTTPKNTPLSINIVSNDTDIDGAIDPTTVTITKQPLNGTVSVNPVTGLLTYTPNANFTGKDSLIYRVCDNGTPLPAQCDTAIVFITVTGVNAAPVANVDGATTIPNTPVTVSVLTNDTDIDNNLDPRTVVVTAQPVNGTVTVDPTTGALTYTPNTNFSGKDSLIYRVCDSGNPALCDTAKVFFTVNPAIACDCATQQDLIAPHL